MVASDGHRSLLNPGVILEQTSYHEPPALREIGGEPALGRGRHERDGSEHGSVLAHAASAAFGVGTSTSPGASAARSARVASVVVTTSGIAIDASPIAASAACESGQLARCRRERVRDAHARLEGVVVDEAP